MLQKSTFLLIVFLFATINGQQVRTVMEFSRELNTCDDVGDNPIETTGTTKVVWAFNENQIPADENSITYHTQRGSESLNLVGQPDVIPPLEPDLQPLDVKVENVHVPVTDSQGRPTDTVYYCKAFELPHDKKRHAVHVEPIIDPRNLANVHHMLIYWCEDDLGDDINFEGPCYDRDLPCTGNSIVNGWAVGGQGEYLPEGVGLPIGLDGPIQVMLEVHYDNPLFLDNIIDSSGMRFWLTEQLRPIDSGIIQLGYSVPSISIPPGETAYNEVGYCSSDCTSQLPPEGVQIFSTVLHAHLAGVAIQVQHLRDGKEIPNVYDDQNYDFNYQQSYALKPELTLLPNDELIITCTYNTVGRNETTNGGASTREEMCFSYLSYYPAHPSIRQCLSAPFVGGQELQICPNGIRGFNPMEYEPLPNIDPCLDYEKPDLPREPTRMVAFDPSIYGHRSLLGPNDVYELYWNYDYQTGLMNFAVDVLATGWAGFGISTGNGAMVGSDVVIGYVDGAGEVYFHDRKAFAPALPPIDDSQDLFDIRVGRFLVEMFNGTKTYKPMY